MCEASAIYDDEGTRRSKVRPALVDAIQLGIAQLVNSDKTLPDGIIPWTLFTTTEWANDVIAILLEGENCEVREGGCDPFTQVSFSTLRFWVQPEVSPAGVY
jgi:hypothetical protein